MVEFSNKPSDERTGVSNAGEPSHESVVKLLELPSDLGRVFDDIAARHKIRTPNIREEIADLRSLKGSAVREKIPERLRQVIESPYEHLTQHLRDVGRHTPLKEGLLRTMSDSLCVLAHRVLSTEGPCLLLLDRDDTIDGRILPSDTAHTEGEFEGEYAARCIRPGLQGFLEELPRHKRELEVGILTARSPYSVFDSHSEERSNWMRSSFSPNHVYSSAEWRVSEGSCHMGRRFLAALCDPSSELFLDVDIDLEPDNLPPDGNPFGKTAAVRMLEREHPEKHILLYDDLEPLPYFLPGQAIIAPSIGVFLDQMFSLNLLTELRLV